MAELGVGYISIVPEVSKISPGIAKALGAAEPVAEKSGKSMGSRISGGIGTALKGTAMATGAAAGGLVATGIAKGMGRLTGIENAQASLRGLGHDAKNVDAIMGDALASVKGTAFGLETAAGVAASSVAAGIKPGEDLERTLKMVGDAATIAGIDMSSMGSIVNKVATSDMMQMDVANQLMDAGIPILQMVADEMGVTADEARKMASEGKISFETFQNALEKGVGGAALEAGNTFKGATANFGAALGRLGATSLKPFFELTKDGLGGATKAVDAIGEKLSPLADNVAKWLDGKAVPAVKNFGDSLSELGKSADVQVRMEQLGIAFDSIVDAGQALWPVVVNVASSLGKAGAALGVAAWDTFVSTLTAAGDVMEAAAGPLESLTGFLADHPALVSAALGAWGASQIIPGTLDKITSAVSPAWNGLKQFGFHTNEAARLAQWMNPELSNSQALFTGLSSQAKRAGGAMGMFKGAVGGVMDIFGGPWGVAMLAATAGVTAIVNSHTNAKRAAEGYSDAIQDSARVNDEFTAAVAGTVGKLSEQAHALGVEVVANSLAGLEAFTEQSKGIVWKLPEPDSTDFTAKVREAAEQAMEESNAVFKTDAGIENHYKRLSSEVKGAYSELGKYLAETGRTMDDLNQIVASGGPEYVALRDHIAGVSDGGRLLAEEFDRVQQSLREAEEAARKLDPGFVAASQAIDVLADSASSGEDKLSALDTLMQQMGLRPKDAERALLDAAKAIDEVVESTEELAATGEHSGLVVFDELGNLDFSNANDATRALVDEMDTLYASLEDVAVNGGDVQGTFEKMKPSLDGIQEAFGLTDDQMQSVIEQFGLVPEEISVAMNLEGASEAGLELAAVLGAIRDMPEGKEVNVGVLSEEAVFALEEIGFKTTTLEDGTVEVTASTEQAHEQLFSVISRLTDMDGIEVSPAVLLDTTPLEGSAMHADAILEALNIQTPTPQADMIIDKLVSGVDISQGELDYLASQTPTPVADLNKTLLQSGVSTSNEMLTALNNRKPTPTLNADGSPLFAAVNSSKAKLNELQDKTVQIRIQEWREYYSTGRSTSTGGTSVGQHYASGGRHLPAYADGDRHPGYRLPSSGPGTNRTDGFLALDRWGMPTARLDKDEWVINGKSSEKYDKELAAINAGVFPKLPGFDTGGRATAEELLDFARGHRVNGQQASRSLQGAPYVWGGSNWGDCSSTQGQLALFAAGRTATRGRYMATMNQEAQLRALGFIPGLGGSNALNIGWFNGGAYGGHTAGDVRGIPLEMGGGAGGQGKIGNGAVHASHSQFTHRAHLPLANAVPVKTGEESAVWELPNSNSGPSGPGLEWSPTAGAGSKDSVQEVVERKPEQHTPAPAPSAAGTKSNAPTSWSQVAGIAASEFASGMVSDALGVFGIPDSPPALKANAQYQEAVAEGKAPSPQQAQSIFHDAMRAVVGDRAWPATPPQAVIDLMKQLRIPGFASGGRVSGPGGPRDDRVPALLSPGEHVINASAAARNRGALDRLNETGQLGSGEVHYHFHGGDSRDLMRQLEARELAATMTHLGG